MIQNIIITVLLITLIISQSIPNSLATEGFEAPLFVLEHNPTICSFEPQPDPNFPNLAEKMTSQTQYAVNDWQVKLSQGQKPTLWKMNLIEIPIQKQNDFDRLNCDITIDYQPKPENQTLQLKEVGVTGFDQEHFKAHIIVYYLGVTHDIQYNSWNIGNMHYWQYIPKLVFTGNLASDAQLGEIIRHELGHSFGLGHYIVGQDRLRQMNQGILDPPSIMLVDTMDLGVNHFDITPIDIAEVKSIYHNQGFNEFLDTTQSNQVNYDLKQDISHHYNMSLNTYYSKIFTILKDEKLAYPTCDNFQSGPIKIGTPSLHMPKWIDIPIRFWAEQEISDQELSNVLQYSVHCTLTFN